METQQSKYFPNSFYRVTVKGLFVKDGKILLLKESEKISGKWELPGGGLNFGEDIHQGLKREITEETGFVVKSISKNPVYVWTWKFENARRMDWYYSLVLAYKVELENLNLKVSDECEKFEFFSKEELENIELCNQTNGFKKVFNPEDF
jgi:8-oxo-dGTP diphosphatase